VLAGLLLVAGIFTVRNAAGFALRAITGGRTTITHAVAIARMEAVGKLVTSETGLRDIVVYEVDYDDPSIGLYGWDALILDRCPIDEILQGFASRENLARLNQTLEAAVAA
jgi:hypothetical protein